MNESVQPTADGPAITSVVVTFDYTRAALYRLTHADGVIAGWTPAGNLQLDFFHESSPAPHRETYLIKADGSRELASSLSGNTVTREKELGVVLALSTTRALHVLLGEQLEQLATRNLMTGPASGNG